MVSTTNIKKVRGSGGSLLLTLTGELGRIGARQGDDVRVVADEKEIKVRKLDEGEE